MYYFSFNFEFVPAVQAFCKKKLESIKAAPTPQRQANVLFASDLPSDVCATINNELSYYKLPQLFALHLFTRPPFFTQNWHKDLYSMKDGRVFGKSTAYNIPIEGCVDCFMEWAEGEVIEIKRPDPGYGHTHPEWVKGPFIVDRLCFERPHFVKVDSFHRASTGPKERTIASLRFQENLSFEDYFSSISKQKGIM